jgi:hypothetical protein
MGLSLPVTTRGGLVQFSLESPAGNVMLRGQRSLGIPWRILPTPLK